MENSSSSTPNNSSNETDNDISSLNSDNSGSVSSAKKKLFALKNRVNEDLRREKQRLKGNFSRNNSPMISRNRSRRNSFEGNKNNRNDINTKKENLSLNSDNNNNSEFEELRITPINLSKEFENLDKDNDDENNVQIKKSTKEKLLKSTKGLLEKAIDSAHKVKVTLDEFVDSEESNDKIDEIVDIEEIEEEYTVQNETILPFIRPNLDFNSEFFDYTSIPILIIPFGKIDSITFEKYFQFLRSTSDIEMQQLNPIKNSKNSTFRNRTWNDGYLKFRMYDDNHGQWPNPWQALNVQKRIFGVIGIIHCPVENDLRKVYNDFVKYISRFSTVSKFKAFAVEPLATQVDFEEENLVLLPPSSDENRTLFYLSTLLADFANSILEMFEDLSINIDRLVPTLSLPIDPIKSSDDMNRLRKRREGRVKKLLGDLALISCSPIDAKNYYVEALEMAKSLNDWIFVASIIECLCTIDLIFGETEPSELMKRYHRALNIYKKKKIYNFAAELLIRIAKFQDSDFFDYNKGKIMGFVNSAVDIISKSDLVSKQNTTMFSPHDKITFYLSCACICYNLGKFRKFAFYTRVAATILKELGAWSAFNQLNVLVAGIYGIPCLSSTSNREKMVLEPPNKRFYDGDGCKFLMIIAVVLQDLIESSKHIGDMVSVMNYSFAVLSQVYSLLNRFEQVNLLKSISELSKILPTPIDIDGKSGIVKCVYLMPNSLAKNLIPLKMKKKPKIKSKNVFIYSPYTNTDPIEQNIVYWVQGEYVSFQAKIENPLSCEIIIDSIKIEIKSNNNFLKSIPKTNIRIPPNSVLEFPCTCLFLSPCEFSMKDVYLSISLYGVRFYLQVENSLKNIVVLSNIARCSLDIESEIFRNLLKRNTTYKIYNGERKKLKIILSNSSDIDIDFIDIRFKQYLKKKVTKNDEKEIKYEQLCFPIKDVEYKMNNNLLISSKSSESINLTLNGIKGNTGGELKISYWGFNQEDFCRTISLNLSLSIVPSLVLSEILVLNTNHLNNNEIWLEFIIQNETNLESFTVYSIDPQQPIPDSLNSKENNGKIISPQSCLYFPVKLPVDLFKNILNTEISDIEKEKLNNLFTSFRDLTDHLDSIGIYLFRFKLLLLEQIKIVWVNSMKSIGLLDIRSINLSKDFISKLNLNFE